MDLSVLFLPNQVLLSCYLYHLIILYLTVLKFQFLYHVPLQVILFNDEVLNVHLNVLMLIFSLIVALLLDHFSCYWSILLEICLLPLWCVLFCPIKVFITISFSIELHLYRVNFRYYFIRACFHINYLNKLFWDLKVPFTIML